MREKTRKRYTAEFKSQAVELVRVGRPVKELAEELGIGADLIYIWVSQSKRRTSGPQGAQGGADELRTLRRENARLQMEVAILKKAAVLLGTASPSPLPARYAP
ncbi:MAG: transposase [Candidatus Methylacidiphilales bacterium]